MDTYIIRINIGGFAPIICSNMEGRVFFCSLRLFFSLFIAAIQCIDLGCKGDDMGVDMVHVITCRSLARNRLDRCYVNSGWLQIKEFLKKGGVTGNFVNHMHYIIPGWTRARKFDTPKIDHSNTVVVKFDKTF